MDIALKFINYFIMISASGPRMHLIKNVRQVDLPFRRMMNPLTESNLGRAQDQVAFKILLPIGVGSVWFLFYIWMGDEAMIGLDWC